MTGNNAINPLRVALDPRGWNTAAGYGDIPAIPELEEPRP